MKNLLIKILVWLIGYDPRELTQYQVQLTKEIFEMLPTAASICIELDRCNASGEWKRHQAYSRLIKQFPDKNKRFIAQAIELAVQRMK